MTVNISGDGIAGDIRTVQSPYNTPPGIDATTLWVNTKLDHVEHKATSYKVSDGALYIYDKSCTVAIYAKGFWNYAKREDED